MKQFMEHWKKFYHYVSIFNVFSRCLFNRGRYGVLKLMCICKYSDMDFKGDLDSGWGYYEVCSIWGNCGICGKDLKDIF